MPVARRRALDGLAPSVDDAHASRCRLALHLVARFVGSLRPGGPDPTEEAWAESQLLDGERELWRRMPGADRRHAAGVARRVEQRLGAEAGRPVLAAALLHDVGKVVARLGVLGRVAATQAALVVGRSRAEGWGETTTGLVGRIGLYLRHPQLGGDLLARAGSDPLTVAWAREHHLPTDRWTLPRPVAEALKAADND